MQRVYGLAIILTIAGIAHAQEDGFKPLFNGKDLTGWHNVNCAPGSWFVKDNMLITTGKPTGYLRTDRQYENFELEFEWFHAPPKVRDKEITRKADKGQELDVHEVNVGNSGLFVWCDPVPATGSGYTRGIEVQVLVGLRSTVAKTGETGYTSHGDIFSIFGAKCKPDRPHPLKWLRCLPSEERAKGAYEWNHYKVVGNDGVLKLHVNGKEVSGVSGCNPRKGYLALESEGTECRFKNIKIKELPSTNPKPEEICDVDRGWKCLFNGIDLDGWKATDEHKAHWKMNDGTLSCDGKANEKNAILLTDKIFVDFELVVDWKITKPGGFDFYLRDGVKTGVSSKVGGGSWGRSTIRVKGDRMSIREGGKVVSEDEVQPGISAKGPVGLQHSGGAVQFRNVFIRELRLER